MGVKPKPVENTELCPYLIWPDGKAPLLADCQFFDVELSSLWIPDYGYPLTANYKVPFKSCTYYDYWVGAVHIQLFVSAYGVEVQAYNENNAIFFHGSGPLGLSSEIENNLMPTPSAFANGYAKLDMYINGWSPPPEWAAASLVGVPEQDGYFAEQGPNGAPDSTYRYANHFNKTNVIMKVE